MAKLEIERKFLLKSKPDRTPDDILSIKQYYWKNENNIWERSRISTSEITGKIEYTLTIKKSLSKSVCMEDEVEISKEDFDLFVEKCNQTESTFISKKRLIYKEGDLKWEVDVFKNGYRLIVAEIEIPKKSFKLTIPDYISKVCLLEVTGLKQFSNRTLSLDINNKKETIDG